jgi:hypothetical protein
MIPRSLSGESHQDSEPMIAVNPANPLEIAATAFTPDPNGNTAVAPIYVSTDGGMSWTLNSISPSNGDITVAFASASGNLYGSILRSPNTTLQILRTKRFTAPAAMSAFVTRDDNDQPFITALTVATGPAKGRDRVYVGNNDFQAAPRTSTIDVSLDGGASKPKFRSIRLDPRNTAGQNGPQIRPACHQDGTVYAAYYGWRAMNGNWQANTLVVTADVVVVRDDTGGDGTAAFQALSDSGDGLAGTRVAQGVTFPFHNTGAGIPGQQRLGGSIAIAVDPRDSATVYLSWADRSANGTYRLHLRASTDRGVIWSSADLRTINGGNNGALAVNADGEIGFLYQQLIGAGAGARWVTHFERSRDGVNWTDVVLATTPASMPAAQFSPYLGDYDHVVAVDRTFYGVFSASNAPDAANFPNGVTYQRNANFSTRQLLDVNGTSPVAVSIDPFFFRVKPA